MLLSAHVAMAQTWQVQIASPRSRKKIYESCSGHGQFHGRTAFSIHLLLFLLPLISSLLLKPHIRQHSGNIRELASSGIVNRRSNSKETEVIYDVAVKYEIVFDSGYRVFQ